MTMDILAVLLILSFATFGLTDLITKQNGLLHIFKRWRNYLAKNRPDIDENNANDEAWELYERLYSAWEKSTTGHLYELFSCPFCLGLWVSALLTVAYTGIGWYSLAYWLGVYGLHSVIVKVTE